MISDPWSVYSEQHHIEERILRLDERLQSSLIIACVSHSLNAFYLPENTLANTARREMWNTGLEKNEIDTLFSRLRVYAAHVKDRASRHSSAHRVIDVLLYAYATLTDEGTFPSESLYSAFWQRAEPACTRKSWVERLLGTPELMEENDPIIAGCRTAYLELCYQEAAVQYIEQTSTAITQNGAEMLGEQVDYELARHDEFTREVYRRSLEKLSRMAGAGVSLSRVLTRYASFEADRGRRVQARKLYSQALSSLMVLNESNAIDVIQERIGKLRLAV